MSCEGKQDSNNNTSSKSDQSEEEQLMSIMSKREWNYARKEWSRRTRSNKAGAASYCDILQALYELEKVSNLVLRCYSRHKKVFKRLGPASKNGGLKAFLEEVTTFREFLEDVFYMHLRTIIPAVIPNEILKIIWEFSQTGSQKFDFGFFSEKKFDQLKESIQRKKFLLMTNTLTMNLINAITMSRMDIRGATIETQMLNFVNDADAFRDLAEENRLEDPDFSKFSKISIIKPQQQASCPSISQYLYSGSARSRSPHGRDSLREISVPNNAFFQEHDYALAGYML